MDEATEAVPATEGGNATHSEQTGDTTTELTTSTGPNSDMTAPTTATDNTSVESVTTSKDGQKTHQQQSHEQQLISSQHSLADMGNSLGSSSVLQDLLKDHSSEIGNWCEIVSNHQETPVATIESFKSHRAAHNIGHNGPYYIFVSMLDLPKDNQIPRLPREFNKPEYVDIQNEISRHFGEAKNLYSVHLYHPLARGCCMMKARDFESCVRVLRKDGETFRNKQTKVEYVIPDTEPPKYIRFTPVQLDAQMQIYREAHPPPPPEIPKPKVDPFGGANLTQAKAIEQQKKLMEQQVKMDLEKQTNHRESISKGGRQHLQSVSEDGGPNTGGLNTTNSSKATTPHPQPLVSQAPSLISRQPSIESGRSSTHLAYGPSNHPQGQNQQYHGGSRQAPFPPVQQFNANQQGFQHQQNYQHARIFRSSAGTPPHSDDKQHYQKNRPQKDGNIWETRADRGNRTSLQEGGGGSSGNWKPQPQRRYNQKGGIGAGERDHQQSRELRPYQQSKGPKGTQAGDIRNQPQQDHQQQQRVEKGKKQPPQNGGQHSTDRRNQKFAKHIGQILTSNENSSSHKSTTSDSGPPPTEGIQSAEDQTKQGDHPYPSQQKQTRYIVNTSMKAPRHGNSYNKNRTSRGGGRDRDTLSSGSKNQKSKESTTDDMNTGKDTGSSSQPLVAASDSVTTVENVRLDGGEKTTGDVANNDKMDNTSVDMVAKPQPDNGEGGKTNENGGKGKKKNATKKKKQKRWKPEGAELCEKEQPIWDTCCACRWNRWAVRTWHRKSKWPAPVSSNL